MSKISDDLRATALRLDDGTGSLLNAARTAPDTIRAVVAAIIALDARLDDLERRHEPGQAAE